ncbi:MAG: hypothetical protein ACTS42_01835 [Candidatus Hodgkinia cicadicola]
MLSLTQLILTLALVRRRISLYLFLTFRTFEGTLISMLINDHGGEVMNKLTKVILMKESSVGTIWIDLSCKMKGKTGTLMKQNC